MKHRRYRITIHDHATNTDQLIEVGDVFKIKIFMGFNYRYVWVKILSINIDLKNSNMSKLECLTMKNKKIIHCKAYQFLNAQKK